MLLVLITKKSAEMTQRNAAFMTNFMKYFRKMTLSSQNPYAATLMVQLNGAENSSLTGSDTEEPPQCTMDA